MSAPTAVHVARDGGNPILRAIGAISTVCGVVAAGMIVASIAITCQMIWVRFVLNGSTIWQTEAVVYLMVGATIVGLPYVQRLRGHVNVDLLPLLLPRPIRLALAIVTALASIVVVGLMTWYGYDLWHVAFSRGWRSDTVWGVQLWIPYLAMPVGFGLFLLQLLADLYATIAGIESPFSIDERDSAAAGDGEAR
jgi:TRAP-type C4-dicarboxylate transport system permease small subunit